MLSKRVLFPSHQSLQRPWFLGLEGGSTSAAAAGLRLGSDSTLRCPKNRSGLRIPSGFSTAAEMECRLFLPPAAVVLHSPRHVIHYRSRSIHREPSQNKKAPDRVLFLFWWT